MKLYTFGWSAIISKYILVDMYEIKANNSNLTYKDYSDAMIRGFIVGVVPATLWPITLITYVRDNLIARSR